VRNCRLANESDPNRNEFIVKQEKRVASRLGTLHTRQLAGEGPLRHSSQYEQTPFSLVTRLHALTPTKGEEQKRSTAFFVDLFYEDVTFAKGIVVTQAPSVGRGCCGMMFLHLLPVLNDAIYERGAAICPGLQSFSVLNSLLDSD
jgi:hypothetical protein